MFSVRSFEGTAEELSDFVVAAWRSTYAGKMGVPHWSGDYLRWQLGLDDENSRDRLVAAYDGDQLAGVVLYFPMPFELNGERFDAAQASWLSVSPDYRGRGVAKALENGSLASLREHGLRYQLGYGYFGAKSSLGLRFWKKQEGKTTTFVRQVGFWVRVLDPQRAGRWNVKRIEGRATELLAPLLAPPRPKPSGQTEIRPIEPKDIPRCLELADTASRHCDLRLIWDEARLSRQLGIEGFGRAMVAVEDGAVRGFIGYHILPIEGRTVEPVGILDLVCLSELSRKGQGLLLDTVLTNLRDAGAVVALKLRSGDYPARTFLRRGWVWRRADSHVLITWAQQPELLPPVKRLHVLWR